MKNIFFTVVLSTIFFLISSGQNPYQPNISGANPVTPSAYQFLKYTELPVSDYTGIPNISVPLYDIKVDDIDFPLSLTYHSVGIKVNQEAGWVGLGWDLNLGSIVQNINDVDDYFNYGKTPGSQGYQSMTKLQPDFSNDVAPPWEYPFAYQYNMGGTLPSVPNPLVAGFFSPVLAPQLAYGYKVTTDYYFPQNGTYTQNTNFFTNHQGIAGNFDSEPDIFRANFLGHSITFMLDWTSPLNYGVIVLNKRGYTVQRPTTTSWAITCPEGDQFFFETENTVSSTSSGYGLFGNTYSGIAQPNTNIWMLTRIITKKNKTITINYTTSGVVNDFPGYSEVWQNPVLQGTEIYNPSTVPLTGYGRGYTQYVSVGQNGWGPTGNGVNPMTNYSTEQKLYPSSIVFQNGQVNFYTSPSLDQLGGMKLDSVKVVSSANNLVNSFKFNYGFFDTLASSGNGYGFNSQQYGAMASLRLKLLSISQLDSGKYTFTYDPRQLPRKNSFAQDYWGFYNGQTTNTSLSPNPARFNLTGLANNGNNHSAFLSNARAGILTGIQYPTGGSMSMQYELNQFNNYWVPDSNSSANTISHGNGLRIRSVSFYNSGTPSIQKFYTYNVGKAIYPISMFKHYNISTLAINGSQITEQDYAITEASSQGFYSTNPLISTTGIGYDTVTKTDDSLGSILGKTVTTFVNTPSLGNNIFSGQSLSATLPAIRQSGPENGSVTSIQYFDKNGTLMKKEQDTYSTISSPFYYGARLFGYSNLVTEYDANDLWTVLIKQQNLIGFYPIYDIETLPSSKTTTEYDVLGDSLVTNEGFGFDQFDQMDSHVKYTSSYYTSEGIMHAGDLNQTYNDPSSQQLLLNTHRYADVLMGSKTQGPLPYQNEQVSTYSKHYGSINGIPLESYMTINRNLIAPTVLTDTVSYDSYDNTFMNPLQYTSQKMRNCILWDYNGAYPIAEVKNATINNVAYTSFEADGSGNWTITAKARDFTKALTGSVSYQLGNGTISTSSVLSTTVSYIVSYWSSNGSYSVTGSSNLVTGKTIAINGTNWTYFEHTVSGVSSVTISGNGNIDELRLYPSTAQMTTFTYRPLIGMTTQCDIANKVTYYTYDAANRLGFISDQDGNVIKKYCYSYNGQASPCAPPLLYYNDQMSLAYIRNNCGSGYTGSSVTYIVPANRYSAFSKSAANQLAINDTAANGQLYANANGTCTPTTQPCAFVAASGMGIGSSGISGSNGTVSFYIVFYSHSSGTNWANSNLVATITGSCLPSVNRTFNINSSSPSGVTWQVTVTTSGQFYARVLSGTVPSGTATIVFSNGSFSL